MGLPGDAISPSRARERFLQGELIEGGVRGLILSSWQRCRLLGLSPDQAELPYRDDVDPDTRLVRAAEPVLDWLQSVFAGSRMNVGLADGSGTVVQRRFGEASMAGQLAPIQSVPGFVFAEQVAGTNGIGIALAERRQCQVYGAEHFAERSQSNACSAIPVRDLLSGRIEGILSLGCPRTDADPVMDTVIREAAHAIERRLLEQSSARERGLLRAYLDARSRTRIVGGAATEEGRPTRVHELIRSGLDRRDQMILMEKATELISSAQRAGVEVPLSHGRWVTLLSHVVISPSGVEGVAVEAVLHNDVPHHGLAVPTPADVPLSLLAEPAALLPEPAAPPSAVPLFGHLPGLAPVPAAGPAPFSAASPAPVPAAGTEPTTGRGRTATAPATTDATAPATTDATGTPDTTYATDAPQTPHTPDTTDDSADEAAERGLVLVGEPEVGKHAVAARRRLELLSEASTRIGTTLDVSRTAQELAEMAVPRLADFVTIDLPDTVLRGEESPDPHTDLRRTVVHGIRDDCPFYPVGERVVPLPTTPHLRCLATGRAVLEPDLKVAAGWLAQDPQHSERLLAHNVHSLITVPLLARGVVLGIASFYRSEDPAPFGDDDRSLAQELATRAAICIDNARRYTREHTMVLALQRSLLPHGTPEQGAVEVAHRYLHATSGVGGDWFDIIPLSGTRVALLVGDVVGQGLHAAVTMARLRTAARNFAELDFAPDEVLTQLDNLVARLDRDEGGGESTAGPGIIGATCLYAIYDPTTHQCAMARAGHLPPALVHPDGTVAFPDLPAGPPLGLGGLPFETAEFHLPEGSELVLYTDGLVHDRHRDIDKALDQLHRALTHSDRSPEATCEAVLDAVVPEHPSDDIALLVARTRAMDPGRIATWELPAEPARVSGIRAAVTRRLADWGLDEVSFAAELVLSELVTNAIRHGSGPIQVRLIHDRSLICEVSDTSSTAPHLRHAAATDEGGRGLFLVAQLTQAWGTRYTRNGKVIWAECALDSAGGVPAAAGAEAMIGIDWEEIPGIE
ncbi:SpoIIE family protein phosphatase [Streptomyces himalayensis]|uniref:SpoIIE family protein phosphatase n=1 Tax=Streptomyces himalayensis subsp. himalayensis TaxID=2756131 RepID=A0A7W0DRZ6_9ACTN|nr:SpoIIE family protein phosphatase [Streptomyces himalayensis]MBA2949374.1 SpoIIE family protein phosphatase [Streptomyces himalayensis subsp. himalayensis]